MTAVYLFFHTLYILLHTTGAWAVWSGTATKGQAHVLYGGSAIQSYLYYLAHPSTIYGTIQTLQAATGA